MPLTAEVPEASYLSGLLAALEVAEAEADADTEAEVVLLAAAVLLGEELLVARTPATMPPITAIAEMLLTMAMRCLRLASRRFCCILACTRS
jgi:hypothetical protein